METKRRLTRVIAATSGILAAALLPVGTAFADDYDFTPNVSTFVPSQAEGYPPLIDVVTGTEKWNIFDLTTNTASVSNILLGTDTHTTFGSFVNDDFLTSSGLTILGPPDNLVLPEGTEIDLANFGLGFENAWMDIPTGTDAGISDLLITPFGDFELFGSAFSDLSTALG